MNDAFAQSGYICFLCGSTAPWRHKTARARCRPFFPPMRDQSTHTHTTFRTQIPITFRIFIYGWTQRIVIYLCVLHFDHLLCALRVPSSAWIVYQEEYNLYKPSAHISLIFTLYPRVGSLQDTSARSAEWLARAVTYVHTISSGGMIYDGRWARFGRVDHRCGLICIPSRRGISRARGDTREKLMEAHCADQMICSK